MQERREVATRRGFDNSFDLPFVAALILAPIDQVSPLASQIRYATTFISDVYGKTIDGDQCLIFQYQGHPWTVCMYGVSSLPNQIARTLSRQLQTKSISFYCGDTDSWLDYKLFQNGHVIEELRCDSYVFGDLQCDGFALIPKQLDEHDDWDVILTLNDEELIAFRSTLRSVSAKELESEAIFNDLFLAQDAWMPDKDSIPYINQQCTAKNLTSADFVRVDAIVRTGGNRRPGQTGG